MKLKKYLVLVLCGVVCAAFSWAMRGLNYDGMFLTLFVVILVIDNYILRKKLNARKREIIDEWINRY